MKRNTDGDVDDEESIAVVVHLCPLLCPSVRAAAPEDARGD